MEQGRGRDRLPRRHDSELPEEMLNEAVFARIPARILRDVRLGSSQNSTRKLSAFAE
jgi:hypothetical protein